MAEISLKEQITLMIQKAFRSLEAAKTLFDEESYDFSSSRSYYSAFYSIQALLLTKNIVYSKHSGVIAGFSEHFIRNGLFPVQYAKHISRLFRERHIGDYDFISRINCEDAEKSYEIATELVNSIKKYLDDNGYIITE
jgi:uncharacterized protein (UPF0332 family)